MDTFNLKKEYLNVSNVGHGLIYNKQTEKFDVSLNMTTDHLIKVTYDELVDLRNTSSLEPGVFYRITDYEFTSTDPEVISAGHRFDIIVLAVSENVLSEDARAIQHDFTEEEKKKYSEEEQHYFDNSDLSAWRLRYCLDADTSRFSWVPEKRDSLIVSLPSTTGGITYRNPNKDEQGYFCYESDNYTIYVTSEQPKINDPIYQKNSDGIIQEIICWDIWYDVKRVLVKVENSDNYQCYILDDSGIGYLSQTDAYSLYIDTLEIDAYVNWGGWIRYDWNYDLPNAQILNPNFTFQDENGISKQGILVIRESVRHTCWTNSGSFDLINPVRFYDYITSSYLGGDCYYSLTLSKDPEIGDVVGVEIGSLVDGNIVGDSYTVTASVNVNGVSTDIPYKIQKVEKAFKVKEFYQNSNKKFSGVIYGMVDEFENDCQYDFKNALITGKYSLFDPDLFYYTFTNCTNNPILVQEADKPLILYPGTYSFLGAIPFRLYEATDQNYVKLKTEDTKYSGWDLYAAICDTEGYMDEDTGEMHYKLEMYTYNDRIQHVVKVCEDKEWYTTTLASENTTEPLLIYSKDVNTGVIESYELQYNSQSDNGYDWVYSSTTSSTSSEENKAWIYQPINNLGLNYKYDYYAVNLNYPASSDFDIIPNQDNLLSSHFTNDGKGWRGVVDSYGAVGIEYIWSSGSDNYTVVWTQQTLPQSLISKNARSYEDLNETYKFTNPITITEPMYMYVSSGELDSYNGIDAYVYGSLMLSSEKCEIGDNEGIDIYASSRDLCSYSISIYLSPHKDSSLYYTTDSYMSQLVKLRDSYSNVPGFCIPKTIIAGAKNCEFTCSEQFIQLCNKVIATNYQKGYNTMSRDSVLFLKNISDSQLYNVDNSSFEDCYYISAFNAKNSNLSKDSYIQLFDDNCVNISDCYSITINYSNKADICHVKSSEFNSIGESSICGVSNSTISNIYLCNITNDNSYGNASDSSYHRIYINGLRYKDVELSDILDGSNEALVHIRSEEDITITV